MNNKTISTACELPWLHFGPETLTGGREAYRLTGNETFIRQIEETFSVHSEPGRDRARMWRNFEALIKQQTTGQRSFSIAELHRNTILSCRDMRISMESEDHPLYSLAREQYDRQGNPLLEDNTLVRHLAEATDFARKLTSSLATFDPQHTILSARQLALITHIVAPFHDLMKFTGSFKAAIIHDHEILGAAFLRQCLPGVSMLFDEQDSLLTDEDITFVSGIVADHESIFRELGRDGFIKANTEIEVSQLQADIKKGKALFFVIDVLTNCFDATALTRGEISIDDSNFQSRFVNLYTRHINKVKVFRPQWGLFAIQDLLKTLQFLADHTNLLLDEGLKGTLVEGGLKAVADAEGSTSFTTEEKAEIRRIREKLVTLKQSI